MCFWNWRSASKVTPKFLACSQGFSNRGVNKEPGASKPITGCCFFFFFCSSVIGTSILLCVWFPQLILGAQCQATLDTQIQEKKQIQTELSEEEKRLDAMMEAERCKALETEEQIDGLRKHERIRWREFYLEIQTKSFNGLIWFDEWSWTNILTLYQPGGIFSACSIHPNHPHPSHP